MCTSPSTKDGKTFACRHCNECVAARRMDWVTRALAEQTLHKHTFAVTLTYGDETQEQRDGAAMFRYEDIRAFLKRLRRHIHYHTGQHQSIRYLCAGEQGDRKGRCHWHLILYTDIDLTKVGEYTAPWGVVTDWKHIVSGTKAKRCRWSFWPHGYVVLQLPDEGGIKYALSYALKDQFAVDKSRGTHRETTAENLATGMFRMSKKPPIGWPFIQQLIDRLGSDNNILPNLKIQIPDTELRWYPRGTVRRLLLEALRDANESIAERTGANAPQWSTLVVGLSDNPNDMEILLHGTQDEDEESAESAIRKKAAEYDHDRRRREVVRRCGSTAACSACLRGLPDHKLASAGIEHYQTSDAKSSLRFTGDETGEPLRKAQRDGTRGKPNPHCCLAGTSYVTEFFGVQDDHPGQSDDDE